MVLILLAMLNNVFKEKVKVRPILFEIFYTKKYFLSANSRTTFT